MIHADFSQNDFLCEKCQLLELSPATIEQRVQESHLGTQRQVKKRTHCPLCRLVAATYPQTWRNGDAREPIVLKWANNRGFYFGDEGHRLVFIQDGSQPAVSPHQAGRLIRQKVDVELIKTWISTCATNHETTCRSEPNVIQSPLAPNGLKFLRVIDVKNECLVEAAPGDTYVALSYVWGNVRPALLRKHNKTQLSIPGGFSRIRNDLPRTISDAMAMVLEIGERYLWVDSLCLVQDDDRDKMDGIQKMDLIYQGAILTIVAAAGTDANASLPSSRIGSRHVSQVVEVVKEGVKMISVSPFYFELSESRYMTRGWTYVMVPPLTPGSYADSGLAFRSLLYRRGVLSFYVTECISCAVVRSGARILSMNSSLRKQTKL
jgi:hypothetical protein